MTSDDVVEKAMATLELRPPRRETGRRGDAKKN
jgi:hypothetical protein